MYAKISLDPLSEKQEIELSPFAVAAISDESF